MLLFGAALRIIADDLGEAVQGRDPLKKKCEWCNNLYSTKMTEKDRKFIFGR